MHEKLSHLSPEEFAELLKRYYDPEKEWTVTRIMQHFKIDARPAEMTSLLPPTVYEELFCDYCDATNLISRPVPRDAKSSGDPFCPVCGHRPVGYCGCRNCRAQEEAARQAREESRREIIRNVYDPCRRVSPPLPVLSLREAIYLKAVTAHSASEDLARVAPFAFTQCALAPTEQHRFDIVRRLHELGALAPDSESKLSAFIFENEADPSPRFYLAEVEWLLLPDLSSEEKQNFLAELDDYILTFRSPISFTREDRSLWHEIVKQEVVEYYEHKRSVIGYEVDKIGDKTHSVFDALVMNLSPAQIYHAIYVSVKNTLLDATERRLPKYHAKNLFIGKLETTGQKYLANGWLNEYGRDFTCPQSTISSIFFDFYLQIGASYWEKIPPAKLDGEAA